MYKKYGIRKTVESLDGVFAFVLIDLNINKIYAAEIQLGVRSMFISNDNGNIGISSEMKCLSTWKQKKTNITQFRPGCYIEISDFS